MWLLIVPLVIVLVVLLSMTALAASLIGALGSNWPWLLIALGAFLFWKEDGRHRHRQRRRAQHGWTPQTVPPTEPRTTDGAVSARVERIDKKAQAKAARTSTSTSTRSPTVRRVAAEDRAAVDVGQVGKQAVDVLLGFADRFPPFSKIVPGPADCQRLPAAHGSAHLAAADAVERPLATGGQAPHQEIRAQLDADTKLDDITQTRRQDVARMLANRQFLKTAWSRPRERATRGA
jgi:hypothetical protein